MRSSLRSLLHCAPVLVALAFVVACQDAPVAPNLRPRAASRDVSTTATFVVTNTANDGAGSLRQAMFNADGSSAALITFAILDTDPGCSGGACTIRLNAAVGLTRPGNVTVDGTGSTVVVSGNDVGGVFYLWAGVTLTLKYLTVQDGRGAFNFGDQGGCIHNAGTLRLDHVTVQRCVAELDGGGIFSEGTLELKESVVADNYAPFDGGIVSSGPLTMNKSSVERNTACFGPGVGAFGGSTITDSRIVDNTEVPGDCLSPGYWGGLSLLGTSTIVRTLVSGNSSARVGGIYNSGDLTLINSTISGNVGQELVGGLWNEGSMQLSHVTVAGNVGAVSAISNGSSADKLRISRSIVDGGAGPACNGVGTDDGYNIDRGTTCGFTHPTSRSNTNPLLGPLADNGGQSFTHKLLTGSPGSPALNAIPVGVNGCGTAGATDQRGAGFARLVGPGCDIGAFEHQVPLPVFGGFLSPVKAGVVNQLNAGRVLPVNFTLGGDFGLTPFVTGYPMVTVTSCPASSVARYAIPLSSTTTGVKASKLNYNALTGQYTYLWVTDKSWAGSCRRLTFQFTGENVAYSLDVEFVK